MTPDGRIHTLDNPTAMTVWEALEGAGAHGLDAEAAAASLAARFHVAPARAATDAVRFLEALARAGLVVRRDGGPHVRSGRGPSD